MELAVGGGGNRWNGKIKDCASKIASIPWNLNKLIMDESKVRVRMIVICELNAKCVVKSRSRRQCKYPSGSVFHLPFQTSNGSHLEGINISAKNVKQKQKISSRIFLFTEVKWIFIPFTNKHNAFDGPSACVVVQRSYWSLCYKRVPISNDSNGRKDRNINGSSAAAYRQENKQTSALRESGKFAEILFKF